MRAGRANNELRQVIIKRGFNKQAEGSVWIEFGNTKVLCNASVQSGTPRFLKGSGEGWITAEYGMLPRSTNERMDREAARGRQGGRTLEIQRLIGRALRSMVNRKLLGENTIIVDCDVIQADGGTRTTAITGAAVALVEAINFMRAKKIIHTSPILQRIAAVSVGILNNEALLDLDYAEDSKAETDLNVVMNENLDFIEVQGTAESKAFAHENLLQMLDFAKQGIEQLLEIQKQALA